MPHDATARAVAAALTTETLAARLDSLRHQPRTWSTIEREAFTYEAARRLYALANEQAAR
jgi:hypothetical protein